MKFKPHDVEPTTEGLGLIVLGGVAVAATIGAIQLWFDEKRPIDKKLAKLASDIKAGKILYLKEFEFPFTIDGYYYQDHDISGQNKSKNLKSQPYVSSQTYIDFIRRIKKLVDVIASISDTDGCATKLQKVLDQTFSTQEIVFKSNKGSEIDRIVLKLSPSVTWPNCDFYDCTAFDKITKEIQTLAAPFEKIASNLQSLNVENSELDKLSKQERDTELSGRLAYIRAVVFVMNLLHAIDKDVTWNNLDRLSKGIDLWWVYENEERHFDGNSWGSY